MNPEQQRIAIAQACGWKRRNDHRMSQWIAPQGGAWNDPPDYLNDLNAMHEAEMTLANDPKFHAYEASLDKVVPMSQRWIFATAAQRAEAFLKALNLWEESK